MDKMLLSLAVVLVFTTGMDAAKPEVSKENLRTLLTDHFTDPRHHVTNPDGLLIAANFIYNTLKSYHIQVGGQTFDLEKNGEKVATGTNIIAIWPGRYHMTSRDRPVILTAHYESNYNMAGVEDNGSGLAAMLEIARIVSSQPCLQDFSVIFAFFDFAAHDERDLQRESPCAETGCGSRAFVEGILKEFLTDSNVQPEEIQGIIVLDGLLNYNNTPGAQQIPRENVFAMVPGFVEGLNGVRADEYRGNFICTMSREADAPLVSAFNSKFNELGNPQFKTRTLTFPFASINNETKQDPLWPLFFGLTDTDIKFFYEVLPEVKAVFVTDTLTFREREKVFNRLTVDDVMPITDDRLEFLKKTTEAVTRMVEDLTGHRDTDECLDPSIEMPESFKPGYRMDGTLLTRVAPNSYQNISLVVGLVQPSGLVNATLSSQSWSLPMAGHYDPVEKLLVFYLLEPLTFAMAPLTIACRVQGRFHPSSRGVTIIGSMRGVCGPALDFSQGQGEIPDGKGGIHLRGTGDESTGRPTAVSSPSLAAPVVLSLLGGMLLSAAVAVALWHVYKRRMAASTTNSLPMKEGL